MKTQTQSKAEAAAYMREHRAAWRSAGFAPMSSMVHDDDKPKLAAFADITKFEKLLSLINADDPDAIDLAATRNTPRLPTFDMVEDVRDLAEKQMLLKETKGIATQAQSLLSTVKTYSTKARQYRHTVDADELVDDKARALAVVYGNLTVSTFRLAEALLRFSPRLGEIDHV